MKKVDKFNEEIKFIEKQKTDFQDTSEKVDVLMGNRLDSQLSKDSTQEVKEN